MPTVRKLTPAEVSTITRKSLGVHRAIELEYDQLVDQLEPGIFEITPDAGEKRATVRSRVNAAMKRRRPTWSIVWHRVRGDAMRATVTNAMQTDMLGDLVDQVAPADDQVVNVDRVYVDQVDQVAPADDQVVVTETARKRGRPPRK